MTEATAASADGVRQTADLADNLPLCVDLDGTLVKVDTLQESALAVLLSHWSLLLRLPILLLRGKAALKQELAASWKLNPANIPYNEELLSYIRDTRKNGRKIVLATAADRRIANVIAEHTGIFDEVIASDGVNNLRGTAKAEALCKRYGSGGFIYAGNGSEDHEVWKHARTAVIVNASAACRKIAQTSYADIFVIGRRPNQFRAALKAMRPYQWVKNLLVFVPMITSHATGDLSAWLSAATIFLAFCATSSGIYLLNDLFDLAVDRSHPRKRQRPLASGALPLLAGVLLTPILLMVGFALGMANGFALVILAYIAMTLSYSVKLKEMPLIDIFMLAALYTIRLFGGGVATGHQVSLWLLAFSSFLFLSLALVKRVEELMEIGQKQGRTTLRRGYYSADAEILRMLGCCSSFASCVVLTLFVQSETVAEHYALPALLWGIVPLMLFWQCRIWLSTARGYMHDDPIVYAARDWVSWIVVILLVAILALASSSSVAKFLYGL